MSEIGKYPLEDDELEKVSGGATANENDTCFRFTYNDPSGAPVCSNCERYDNGACKYIR